MIDDHAHPFPLVATPLDPWAVTLDVAHGGDARPLRLCLSLLGITGLAYVVVHRIYPGYLGRS